MPDMNEKTTGAVESAQGSVERAADGKAGTALVKVGLITYGVVHVIVAWLALQLAWAGGGEEASQTGALAELADDPVGIALLWLTVIGMFALVLWMITEAGWGHRDADSKGKRIRRRIGSAGRAVVYALLGVAAFRFAVGAGSSGGSGEETMSGKLMSAPAGRILVVLIGLGIIAIGGRNIYRGVTKKFTRDLAGGGTPGVVKLGMVGFIAKGVAFAVVGVLFALAGINHDPEQAGGLDDALRTLLGLPFGQILLTAVALGIAAFGVYCFFWARNPKKH